MNCYFVYLRNNIIISRHSLALCTLKCSECYQKIQTAEKDHCQPNRNEL